MRRLRSTRLLWVRRCRRLRGGASTWRWSRRFVRSFMRWAIGSMCFCFCCTTSRGTAGRLRRCGGTLRRSMRRGFAALLGARLRVCRRLPVQYADYTLWQQAVLGDEADAGSALSRQLAYWTDRLRDLPEQLDLPGDRARPAVASHRGGSVAVSLPASLHGGLVGACAGDALEPVHGGAGGSLRAADAAGGGDGHRDRFTGCGAQRRGAGRSGGVLRQHAGAADRHVGAAELPRAGGPRARRQPCGVRPSGRSVRASCRGVEPVALAVAPPAVPGDAGVPEQRGGGSGARGCGGRRSRRLRLRRRSSTWR